MPYWEGQSIGVTPPGIDAKGKPYKVMIGCLWGLCPTAWSDLVALFVACVG